MIDGDYETAGASAPLKAGYADPIRGTTTIETTYPKAEAIVTLPQKRVINKVVLVSFQLNKDKFAGECESFVQEGDDWRSVKRFRAKTTKTEIRIMPIETDQIRFRLPARLKTKGSSRQLGRTTIYVDIVAPEINEIELYGPATKDKKATEDKTESELDLLL